MLRTLVRFLSFADFIRRVVGTFQWWGFPTSPNPALLEDYKYPAQGTYRRLFCPHWCKHCLSPDSRASPGMESNFWSVQVKQAWDSVPLVQEAQPPLLPSFSEDRGPWPLPFYPVLGEISSDDGGDYQEQPLPVWMNDFAGTYPRTDSCKIQSTSEPSIPESVSAIHEEQPEKPTTLGTWMEAVEESFRVAMQPWSCSTAPHRGNDAKDTETCGRSSSTECEQPSESGEVDSGLCQDAWRAFIACLFCGLLPPDSGSSEP